MYSLRLSCAAENAEIVSAELWELGTSGIHELDYGERTVLIAAFERDARDQLLDRFTAYEPEWEIDDGTDWIEFTQRSWPAREIGERIFLRPVWSKAAAPPGRLSITHNPGLASGTGEHPCTQLAIVALESRLWPGSTVIDVGTGSGILAIAAARLGAAVVIALDTDCVALQVARENFALNALSACLAAGSPDCLAESCADVTVVNISGSVILDMLDDLLRITARNGCLILTGFNDSELPFFEELFPDATLYSLNEWRCLAVSKPITGNNQ